MNIVPAVLGGLWPAASLVIRLATMKSRPAGGRQPEASPAWASALGCTGVKGQGTCAKGCPGTWEVSKLPEPLAGNRPARQTSEAGLREVGASQQ
jgi:hypothetical protein